MGSGSSLGEGGRDKEGMAAALKWQCFTYLFGFDHFTYPCCLLYVGRENIILAKIPI